MLYSKIKISDLPKGITPIDYCGYWTEIDESNFIDFGKTALGEIAFNDLFDRIKREKINFLFYTKNPEYAIRVYFSDLTENERG